MATDGELSEGELAGIIRALELIHDRSSTNELRREALTFVESQKESRSAASNGFILASRTEGPPLVRHFGLTLLDHVLRHTTFATTEQLRDLVWNLAQSIQPQDPPFVRNKIAQLWAEVAKRSWGLDWISMDERLVGLWDAGNLVHKEFVLSVLETLSEDVFFREDTVSSLRGSDLNRALFEIFTPAAVYEKVHGKRQAERGNRVELRFGQDGWLVRIRGFLDGCIQNLQSMKGATGAALKCLATFKSVLAWCTPTAVLWSNCIPSIFRSLACEDDDVRLVRYPEPA